MGKSDTDAGAAYGLFIDFLYKDFARGLAAPGATVMLQAFVPRFVEAYKALAIKDYDVDLDTVGCPGFAGVFDCTTHNTAAPGTGPVNGTTERRDPSGDVQRSFYNVYKAAVGVKSQVLIWVIRINIMSVCASFVPVTRLRKSFLEAVKVDEAVLGTMLLRLYVDISRSTCATKCGTGEQPILRIFLGFSKPQRTL